MRDKAQVAFKNAGCPYFIPEKLPYPVVEYVAKPIKYDWASVNRWGSPMILDPKKKKYPSTKSNFAV